MGNELRILDEKIRRLPIKGLRDQDIEIYQQLLDAQIAHLLSLYDTPEKLKEEIAKSLWDGLKIECHKCDWEVANKYEREPFYAWAEIILNKTSLHSLSLVAQAKKEAEEKHRQLLINIMATIGSLSDSEDWDMLGENSRNKLEIICEKIQQALKQGE